MRETNDRFIIYDIDLPITLCNRESMFEENSFENISLDTIAAYLMSLVESPRQNHVRISKLYKTFQDFKKSVEIKNDRNLPVVYERIPHVDDSF